MEKCPMNNMLNNINAIYAAINQPTSTNQYALDSFRSLIETDFSQAFNLFKSDYVFYHASFDLNIPTYQILSPMKNEGKGPSLSQLFIQQMSKYKDLPKRENSILMSNFENSIPVMTGGVAYIVFPKNNAKLGAFLGDAYTETTFMFDFADDEGLTVEEYVERVIETISDAILSLMTPDTDDVYYAIRKLPRAKSINELNAQIKVIDSLMQNIDDDFIARRLAHDSEGRLLNSVKRNGLKKFVFNAINKLTKNPNFGMYSIQLTEAAAINEYAEFWTESPCLAFEADNERIMEYLSQL